MAVELPVVPFHDRTVRLIASRHPPVGVFDELVAAEDAEAALELESLTNDRLTGALGRLAAIPSREWALGAPGATLAMAAFLHPAPGGGRFNAGTLGAWYAARTLETAIDETVYHHTRRLRASEGGLPSEIQMRELVSRPAAALHDLRGCRATRPALYDPDPANYGAGQRFGEALRAAGADGILYDSVRREGGENLVLYKPRLAIPVLQGDHFLYAWDKDGRPSVSRLTSVA